MSDDPYAFELFPRRRLNFRYDRRGLLSHLASSLEAVEGREQGKQAFSLAELGEWPDGDLAELKPALVPGCRITLEGGFVCGQPPGEKTARRLFPQNTPAQVAFDAFDGQTYLDDIAAEVAAATGWDAARAFAYTRGLFLTLVLAGVCQPQF